MNWEVITDVNTFFPGAVLHFTEMTTAGEPPSAIQPNDTFNLQYANNSRGKGLVVAETNGVLEVTVNGQQARLRPWKNGDRPPSTKSPDLHWQNWVVL